MNYATTGKELLAIVFLIKKFRPYLLGSNVIVSTDHTTLRYLITIKEIKPTLDWSLLLYQASSR